MSVRAFLAGQVLDQTRPNTATQYIKDILKSQLRQEYIIGTRMNRQTAADRTRRDEIFEQYVFGDPLIPWNQALLREHKDVMIQALKAVWRYEKHYLAKSREASLSTTPKDDSEMTVGEEDLPHQQSDIATTPTLASTSDDIIPAVRGTKRPRTHSQASTDEDEEPDTIASESVAPAPSVEPVQVRSPSQDETTPSSSSAAASHPPPTKRVRMDVPIRSLDHRSARSSPLPWTLAAAYLTLHIHARSFSDVEAIPFPLADFLRPSASSDEDALPAAIQRFSLSLLQSRLADLSLSLATATAGDNAGQTTAWVLLADMHGTICSLAHERSVVAALAAQWFDFRPLGFVVCPRDMLRTVKEGMMVHGTEAGGTFEAEPEAGED